MWASQVLEAKKGESRRVATEVAMAVANKSQKASPASSSQPVASASIISPQKQGFDLNGLLPVTTKEKRILSNPQHQ